MAEITVDIDLSKVFAGYKQAERRSFDLTPVFRRLIPIAKRDIRKSAVLREGPDSKWPKLAKGTLKSRRKARKRGKRPAKGVLGKLSRAVRVTAGRDFLRETSLIPWSGVHQDGAKVGRGATVPQRTFLYFSNQFLDLTTEAIQTHVWSKY